MKRLKSWAGPYLQADFSSYDYSNASVNNVFRIKLTQNGVCPFIMFYVQTKENADDANTQFLANQLAVSSYKLIGPNNQALMNNVSCDTVINNCVNARHFKDVALITEGLNKYTVSDTSSVSKLLFSNNMLIANLNVLNFCINPKLAFKGDYVGGQLITDNDYELELTLPAVNANLRIGVFLFKYQMAVIKDKSVVFLER